MRNGPIDLTPFGALLTGIGAAYWLVMLVAAGMALWLPKRWWMKGACAAAVLAAFIVPIATRVTEQRQEIDAAQSRLADAMTRFEMRCKNAGEKISRTVDGVEGVVWMRWRNETLNFAKQYELDDPYGQDCIGEGCIKELLRIGKGIKLQTANAKLHERGYLFVETRDPRDGRLYRYTGQMKPIWKPEAIEKYRRETGRELGPDNYRFTLEREPIESYTARYGITWEDISTSDDRDYWIAGGSLKVVDLRSNEVVAERIGYMVDRGQGSTAGERSPWSFARDNACPALVDPAGEPTRVGFTKRFAWLVLQPSL